MSFRPLLSARAFDGVIGVGRGRELRAGAFIAAVGALARRLPERAPALLLCSDRLAFAVAFCALRVARGVALLPSSHAEQALERIVRTRKPALALVDRPGTLPNVGELVVDPWTTTDRHGDDVPEIDESEVAAIVHTSGTSGEPQSHIKTWANLANAARVLADRVDFRPGDAVVGAVPPQHMWGIEATVMMPLQNGGVLHPGTPLLPDDIVAALTQAGERAWLVGTPLHIAGCLRANVTMPPMAGTLSATAPLDAALAQRFEVATKAPLIEIYGATEAGVLASRRTAIERRYEPLDGVVFDTSGERPLVSGGHVPGSVALSDRIEIDGERRFTLIGRDSDLVKVGGKRTSLAVLNHELRAIDGVVDGEFVVLEGGGIAQRLAALVVAPTLSTADITRELRRRIDDVFLPRPLHIVESLPRNALGKAPIDALRRRVVELSTKTSDSTSTSSRVFVVPADHPALPGHFRGRPIVPAAWLLTLIGKACDDAFGLDAPRRLAQVRFRAPLVPGLALRIELVRETAGRIAFVCADGDRRVADGTFALPERS
ncbi:MAG TPA: AMP-binding protein [Casimicrobiaceae bacterium]|nr:AMP-binding protein [Casimicrobiaceae bacterium]